MISSQSSLPNSLQMAAVRGLEGEGKTLPSALFYDSIGARLFEEICKAPEYYPTRTELSILDENAATLATRVGPEAALIEYGSGAGEKIQYLLDHLASPVAYIPVDVSRDQLLEVAENHSAQYPNLPIVPICADYTQPFDFPKLPINARRVAFFPGSTIGNFHPSDAVTFLRQVRHTIKQDGKLILGVDRRKDPAVLQAAYNDKAGITAEFNLNILAHLNRELDATFNLSHFRHIAFFNDEIGRIEMHLESLISHRVMIAGRLIDFEAGETIHTECSYKYDEERLIELVNGSGFFIDDLYTDSREWFWLVLLSPAPIEIP
jgi:dimethylhistidine N-methyltransferase